MVEEGLILVFQKYESVPGKLPDDILAMLRMQEYLNTKHVNIGLPAVISKMDEDNRRFQTENINLHIS